MQEDSRHKLATTIRSWTVTKVAQTIDGQILAYDLGNGQWVSAKDLELNKATEDCNIIVYSNYKPLMLYQDASLTAINGRLQTHYYEWKVSEVAKDVNGRVVAYKLGQNQWVKATDVMAQQAIGGTFVVKEPTPLVNLAGTQRSTVTPMTYQVFAVRYINGYQYVCLGSDQQWIQASKGDYDL